MTAYRKIIGRLPIRRKLMLAIVGTSFASVLVCSIAYIGYGWFSAQERIKEQLASIANMFSENVSAALSFSDERAANELLASLSAIGEMQLACVYNRNSASGAAPILFAAYQLSSNRVQCATTLPDISVSRSQYIEVISPISLGSDDIGYVYLRRGVSDLWDATQLNAAVVAIMMLVSGIFAVAISSLLQALIAGPVQRLVETTRQVSSQRDYTIRARKETDDEVGLLFDSFNDMLEQVQRRDEALRLAQDELQARINESEATNQELKDALVRLRRTQEQLVNTEKMASLGGLVAGVAHEINTPIGVGVTAASSLKITTEEVAQRYEEGALTNSGLKKYVDHAIQSTTIILTNLNRAAELIHSFKQVAVDQSSSEHRKFRVNAYIGEILLSLRPKLKRTRLNIKVNCDDQLEIDSYPGALSQIITNLVVNSLIHAFDDDSDGNISIDVQEEYDIVTLTYSDDGKGMSPETLQKVFEPFFTTRRGMGGSGLGMHIVYNLVAQQLKGAITIESQPGEGTCVTIRFPNFGSTAKVVEQTNVRS